MLRGFGRVRCFGIDRSLFACNFGSAIWHKRRGIPLVVAGRYVRFSCYRSMDRLKADVVLAKQRFVMPDTIQKFALWEPAPALTRDKGRRHALGIGSHAVCARKLAVTLDLPLLARHARQYALGLCHGR